MNRFSDQSEKYHLEPLHRLLETKIPTAISIQYPLEEELRIVLIQEVEHAAKIARVDIDRTMLDMDKQEAQRYVRFYQHQLGKLIDGLNLCAGNPPLLWEDTMLDEDRFCKWLFSHLEDLMIYLAQRYPEYFDFEAFIPYGYLVMTGWSMEPSINIYRPYLNKVIGEPLTEILLQPISHYLDWDKTTNISYRYTFYVNQLFTRLPSDARHEQEVHIFLHKIAFNTPEYIQYYQDHMRRQIRDTSPHKTLQLLNDLKAFVIQYTDERAKPLLPNGERLTTVMVRWLDAELVRIQQSGTSEPPLTVNEALGNTEEPASREKSILNASVKELGLLLRLAAEGDLISDVNIREICRQASALFSTVNAEEPSEKSIYKSFFTPEPAAIERLIPILKKLLEFLQQPEIPPYVKKDKRGKNPEKD